MKASLFIAPVLLAAVVASALGQVYAQHVIREKISLLESLQAESNRLAVDWGRLQLEEGARTSPGLVEVTARKRLQMYLPEPQEVRLVQ